ncbi:MAG: SAM-dependent DNA methyltransferase [Cyclobacteriaceae bacterium]|nr:SAM-dependent DNA methyltransferase [Cyclobacteriaceae bacterium]
MPGLNSLFKKLDFDKSNGLYSSEDILSKQTPFPFRISHVLNDVLKPNAVLSPFQNITSSNKSFNPVNNPLILVFDNPSDQKRKELASQCFSFSQAPAILITDNLGRPEIYHGYDFEGSGREQLRRIDVDISLFHIDRIASGETWRFLFDNYYKDIKKVDRWLLNNVVDARRLLVSSDVGNLPFTIANRLIGRLLFIRYLIDRNVQFSDQSFIVGDDKKSKAQSLNNLLTNKTKLYGFFNYIASKFKGDLFPMNNSTKNNENELELVSDLHLEILFNLFNCSKFFVGENVKGYYVQPSLFDTYDFEVIPVELISNIYENFLGTSNNEENKKKSIRSFSKGTRQSEIKAYYTPPYMVDYVLSQTVDKKLNNSVITSAKVLDPACGSGIFLVETIRKLVQHHIDTSGAKSNSTISNEELWNIVKENIYGIDIDNQAVEITILSIYITLLDYKTPIEIENFKFLPLKGTNLFSGLENDFFNEDSKFQKLLLNKNLDFIVGNPPWGKVKESSYLDYLKKLDGNRFPKIGKQEISQAFLIRVKDFMKINTECMLIVTGKVLYNTEVTKEWRQWLLAFYEIIQVAELSPVNNKVTGGPEIFEGAKQSPAILHFKFPTKEFDFSNLITHTTFRPNNNFLYFKAITISRRDIKYIPQFKFIDSKGGADWLWKILVHGSFFDFQFIKRLKSDYPTLSKIVEINKVEYKGGLKFKDGNKKVEYAQISNLPFLELESRKEFKQFSINPSKTIQDQVEYLRLKGTIDENQIAYLPDLKFFKGFKLLCKKGLEVGNDFNGVSAISKSDLAFPSSVMSFVLTESNRSSDHEQLLWNIAGLINSKLFSYYVFNTSSSAGIDRTRVYFKEFLDFPVVLDGKVASQAKKIQELIENKPNLMVSPEYESNLKIEFKKLNSLVFTAYNVSRIEQSLIDYALQVAIPEFKRIKDPVYILSNHQKVEQLKAKLIKYSKVFSEHFKKLGNLGLDTTISIGQFYSISIFKITQKSNSQNIDIVDDDQVSFLNKIPELTTAKISQSIYVDSDLRGFGRDYFYIVKPSEFKYWHEAVAHEDLSEIIRTVTQA